MIFESFIVSVLAVAIWMVVWFLTILWVVNIFSIWKLLIEPVVPLLHPVALQDFKPMQDLNGGQIRPIRGVRSFLVSICKEISGGHCKRSDKWRFMFQHNCSSYCNFLSFCPTLFLVLPRGELTRSKFMMVKTILKLITFDYMIVHIACWFWWIE